MTGLGTICCLGQGIHKVWPELLNGAHGFAPATLAGFQDFRCRVAGQIPDALLEAAATEGLPPHISRHELLGWIASCEALADASWERNAFKPDEVGVAAGIGAAGMLEAEEWVRRRHDGDKRHPAWRLYGYPASSLADLLAAAHNWRGPRFSIATACSSSGTSLGMAADAIRNHRARAFVVVGSESLSRLTYAGFQSLRSIAPDICRPFDRDRKGLILGEGAAALVLEDLESAQARGATIYGEILGWGLSSDGHHMTAPHPEGKGAAKAMGQALARAGISPEDVGYINLHGTGTRHNDLAETKAVKSVFKDHCRNLLLSSTKSMTGHCLGAAGAIESLFTLLALHHGMAPPTANLENPDPACDLNYVPRIAQPVPALRFAMNNVMAFGGNNVALVFGKTGGQ